MLPLGYIRRKREKNKMGSWLKAGSFAMVKYKRVLIYSWGTRGDIQPPLALAIRLRELGKEVTMFVTPPSDDLVKKAGIDCVVAKENVANLLEALGKCDLSNMSICNIITIVKAMKA